MASDALDPVGVYLGTQSGAVYVSPSKGDDWVEAARNLPPVLSVEVAQWPSLPSLLATQAGGRSRFEVDAATVGDALRALPIADLLLDERGALRGLVNVYVDGADPGGLDAPLEATSTVRVVAAIAGG